MTAEVCGRKVFSPRLAAVPLLSCHTSSTTSSSSSSMYSVNLALGALCAAAAATSAADSTALAPPPKALVMALWAQRGDKASQARLVVLKVGAEGGVLTVVVSAILINHKCCLLSSAETLDLSDGL